MSAGLFHMLLSQGITLDFSSYILSPDNPVVLAEAEDNNALRDQCIFEIDSNTWGMSYACGQQLARLGVRYATAPKTDPHNWTKITNPFLVESNPLGWDTDIDSGDIIRLDDGSWVMCYTDEGTGKFGIATRAAGSFGAFTKHPSNPVIDNTGDTGAWNQYIRHASIIKKGSTYYTFFEAREGGPSSGVTNNRIGRATSIDLQTWTLDDTPVFQQSDFPAGSFLSENKCWMPSVHFIQGRYYMTFLSFDNNLSISTNTGFYIAVSNDLDTWEVLNGNYPFFERVSPCGSWDSRGKEESTLFYENGNLHLYFNGDEEGGGSSNFNIGYLTIFSGGEIPGIPEDLFSDDFNDASIDPAKWDDSPQGGITVTEVANRMLIAANGSTQALVEVLAGLTGFSSNLASWSMAFGYERDNAPGGDLRIGTFNSSNTTYACFARGSSTVLNQIRMLIVVGGVTQYDQTVAYRGGRLKIVREGCLFSFWVSNVDGKWTNLTINGGSDRGDGYVEISASVTFFPKVLAQNATTAYNVRINDVVIKPYNDPFEDPYILTDYTTEEISYILARLTTLTSQEQTALTTFVTSCIEDENWKNWDELYCYKFNSTDAPKGWKLRTSIVNGATHVTNGYSFDGVNDYISTEFNPDTQSTQYGINSVIASVYLYSVGTQTSNRFLLDGNDGTDTLSIFHNGTDKRVRINKGTSNVRVITGTFASDKVYTAVRNNAGSTNENLWIDGVLQSATGGAASTGRVNDVIEIGRQVSGASFLDGTIGFVAIGGNSSTFNHVAWNTAVRQLLADLN